MFKLSTKFSKKVTTLPNRFLNGYEIVNTSELEWWVREYKFERLDGRLLTHKDRSGIKAILWELRGIHAESCSGMGFVVDVSPDTVVVPDKWMLPVPLNYKDYRLTAGDVSMRVNAATPTCQHIASAIIRDGIKFHIKKHSSPKLGKFWQDYDSFCQSPKLLEDDEDVDMCRRFEVVCKRINNGRLVIEIIIGTTIVDTETFADYYRKGCVSELAGMIRAKQEKRVNRQGEDVEVRAVRMKEGQLEAVEIDDLESIFADGKLKPEQQKAKISRDILTHAYGKAPVRVALNELKLILDSQITLEDHAETILAPCDRELLVREMREFIEGAEVFKKPLFLSDLPVDLDSIPSLSILPPRVRVRGDKTGAEIIIEAPGQHTSEELNNRLFKRQQTIRRNGFLEQRSIFPLLAWPAQLKVDDTPAKRMHEDLNRILDDQNINFKFDLFIYDDVESLRKEIERGEYNALMAVLPERSTVSYHEKDTHDQIKRRISVPSQCIHFDNTLSPKWTHRSAQELKEKDSRLARRIKLRYELSLGGLLVKHGWIPFAPADAFNYNVHFGLDVGGTHNTDVVSCIGYGFGAPQEGLFFRPDKIPVTIAKSEPIPTGSLYVGLLEQIESVHSKLKENGRNPDFEKVLFFRDGQLQGDGDLWNERDALLSLHAELLKREWISEKSVWTVVEIMKYAEGWRVFGNDSGVSNALVGECYFPFEDENKAIICTTGNPYRMQGTAAPLLAKVSHLSGTAPAEKAYRDLVWSADLGFTKPDMGLRLPWVLYVADTGALQQSRSYEITGITAS